MVKEEEDWMITNPWKRGGIATKRGVVGERKKLWGANTCILWGKRGKNNNYIRRCLGWGKKQNERVFSGKRDKKLQSKDAEGGKRRKRGHPPGAGSERKDRNIKALKRKSRLVGREGGQPQKTPGSATWCKKRGEK